jgi:hypothetical protein
LIATTDPLKAGQAEKNRLWSVSHDEMRRVPIMYVRAVRFTDVSTERMQELLARIEDSDGPPPGVPATGLKVLSDDAQGTALVLQYFESAEDMEAGDKVFSAMDPAETPGTRASVDMCELRFEQTLS